MHTLGLSHFKIEQVIHGMLHPPQFQKVRIYRGPAVQNRDRDEPKHVKVNFRVPWFKNNPFWDDFEKYMKVGVVKCYNENVRDDLIKYFGVLLGGVEFGFVQKEGLPGFDVAEYPLSQGTKDDKYIYFEDNTDLTLASSDFLKVSLKERIISYFIVSYLDLDAIAEDFKFDSAALSYSLAETDTSRGSLRAGSSRFNGEFLMFDLYAPRLQDMGGFRFLEWNTLAPELEMLGIDASTNKPTGKTLWKKLMPTRRHRFGRTWKGPVHKVVKNASLAADGFNTFDATVKGGQGRYAFIARQMTREWFPGYRNTYSATYHTRFVLMDNPVMTPGKDYQFFAETELLTIPAKPRSKNSTVSPFMGGASSNPSIKGIFAIDWLETVKKHNPYPVIFENNPSLLGLINIVNVKITRKRVKDALSKKGFADTFDTSIQEPIEIISFNSPVIGLGSDIFLDLGFNETAQLVETDIKFSNPDHNIRHFSFVDRELQTKEKGLYQYGVEFEIEDKLTEYLYRILQNLASVEAEVKQYLTKAEENYDPLTLKYTKRFLAEKRAEARHGTPWWVRAVISYMECFKHLSPKYSYSYSKVQKNHFVNLSPFSSTPESIRNFLELCGKLIKEYEKLHIVDEYGQLNSLSKKAGKQGKVPVVKETIYFDEIIDFDILDKGYDYLQIQGGAILDGLSRIPVKGLEQTLFLEGTYQSDIPLIDPIRVKTPGKDLVSIVDMTDNSIPSIELSIVDANLNSFFSVSPNIVVDSKSNLTPAAQEYKIKATSFFSREDLTVNTQNEIFKVEESDWTEDQPADVFVMEESPENNKELTLSLFENDHNHNSLFESLLDDYKILGRNSNTLSIEEYKSRVNTPTMKATMDYLSGYETGDNGEAMLKNPIWEPLTQQVRRTLRIGENILCRISTINNASKNVGMKMNIYDKYFLLEGSEPFDPPAPVFPDPIKSLEDMATLDLAMADQQFLIDEQEALASEPSTDVASSGMVVATGMYEKVPQLGAYAETTTAFLNAASAAAPLEPETSSTDSTDDSSFNVDDGSIY